MRTDLEPPLLLELQHLGRVPRDEREKLVERQTMAACAIADLLEQRLRPLLRSVRRNGELAEIPVVVDVEREPPSKVLLLHVDVNVATAPGEGNGIAHQLLAPLDVRRIEPGGF